MELLSRIENYSLLNGSRCAVRSETEEITFEKLWEDSGRLARWISEHLAQDKKPIVVYGHKKPEMLMFFLACVRSGRAYCPVDVSVPNERIKDIIQQTDTEVILTSEEMDPDTAGGRQMVNSDQARFIIENTERTIEKQKCVDGIDTFYIIFTSGSTGKPKGVCVTADNLDAFLRWSSQISEGESSKYGRVFMNQAPFSFDLSVMDTYTSLWCGGTLQMISRKTQNSMKDLTKLFAESKINYWVSTPSFAEMCCSEPSFNDGLLPELKEFYFCGETLTNRTAGNLRERFPEAKIINTYGPTETTVAVTSVEISNEMIESGTPLPVGAPGAGTVITIVDETGRCVEDGERGEIVISGETVSAGYYKSESQTARVFCGNRIRSYHTGDKGYMQEGELHFCGRMDMQVKYHGYRIELGDIENNLLHITDIRQAAVVPKMKSGAIKTLVAFISGMGIPAEPYAESKRVKAFLRSRLPEYMVPKKIIFLDKIPVTANGKADRRALKELVR